MYNSRRFRIYGGYPFDANLSNPHKYLWYKGALKAPGYSRAAKEEIKGRMADTWGRLTPDEKQEMRLALLTARRRNRSLIGATPRSRQLAWEAWIGNPDLTDITFPANTLNIARTAPMDRNQLVRVYGQSGKIVPRTLPFPVTQAADEIAARRALWSKLTSTFTAPYTRAIKENLAANTGFEAASKLFDAGITTLDDFFRRVNVEAGDLKRSTRRIANWYEPSAPPMIERVARDLDAVLRRRRIVRNGRNMIGLAGLGAQGQAQPPPARAARVQEQPVVMVPQAADGGDDDYIAASDAE